MNNEMNVIRDLVINRFGIIPGSIIEVQGGWSAKAYRLDTNFCSYFLKVYDKSLPSIQPWMKRIDSYMPVLGWLSGTPELGRNVIHPITTLSDEYKAETEDDVFVLFDFIFGETPGEKGLTDAQTAELAGIIARLHNLRDIPCDNPGLAEDISVPFCENVTAYLNKAPGESDLDRLIYPHAKTLHAAAAETLRLRDTVRLNARPLVLCHADAHAFNVIQSDRLVLADWEDLKWGPAEMDLILFAMDSNWDIFWKAYSAVRPDFQINFDLIRFYLIRRHLEDIWGDIARISFEKPGRDETAQMTEEIKTAISGIEKLLTLSSAQSEL